MKQAKEFWSEVLALIERQVPRQSYSTWFAKTEGLRFEGHDLIVGIPNVFFADWLEQHYLDRIEKSAEEVAKMPIRIRFAVPPAEGLDAENPAARRAKGGFDPGSTREDRSLQRLYTFDNFVVGSNNQLAQAVALAVAEMPGRTRYNPFLIYGGVGLGKTHLLFAIGNFIKENNPKARVLYESSERFTKEFIASIGDRTVSEFSSIYRSLDVLLVDDIQFFGGKERTQQEFFNIFNTLHQAGKQVVMTSDCPPSRIEGFEERLLSRLEWGMVADIQSPDLETKMAILSKKAEYDGLHLSSEVAAYIAQNVTSSIRELEGCLIRLMAVSSLEGREVTLDMAIRTLGPHFKAGAKPVTIEDIQRRTAEYYGIPEAALRDKSRVREVTGPRMVAMYLARELTGASLKAIGRTFGGRDHATVMHACKTVKSHLESDPQLKLDLEFLEKKSGGESGK